MDGDVYLVKANLTTAQTNKETQKILLPVGIWFVMCFVSLGLLAVSEYFVLLLFASFISIIPIFIWTIKKAKKIHKKNTKQDTVKLYIRDNNIYYEDMCLIVYRDLENKDVTLVHQNEKGIGIFAISVTGSDIYGLLNFCEMNDVKIEDFEE